MHLLVTGGAGFIGSNFVRLALSRGDKVTVFDKLTYAGNPNDDASFSGNLLDVRNHPKFSFVKGDVCDAQSLLKALQGCDAVVHFAAESHVDRSLETPDVFLHTNVNGTATVLKCVDRVSPHMRVLHVSTDEVYGSVETGYCDEHAVFQPTSPYSKSKAEADKLALELGKNIVVSRSSNNFGSFQFPEKLVSLSIVNLLLGEKIPVYGSGMNVRDWIFVQDNCDALYFLLTNGTAGQAYNVAGGNERTNISIVKELVRLCGRDESFISYVTDRPYHDFRYALSGNKLSALGWRPKHEFSDALQQTVVWFKQFRSWWEPLRNRRYTSINAPKK
ncbi:dTDP-glucose 4,6-dehydratase [Candidatus Woesearchaeota archaeon]|nr:dTDP-glucose 4,6-dehydratase [Candidatus Woesearchaeota archaeon]